MGAIISRPQWGARYRNGVGNRPVGSLEKYFHHDAFGSSPGENASFAQDAAHMRAIERVGQQRFGAGISYTFGISRAGRIFQGADVHRISYHSGGGRNTRGTGWVLFGNYDRYQLTAKQLAAIVWLLQYGVDKGLWGDPALTEYHQQFRSTACPGKNAIAKFPEINRRGRGGSVSAPSASTGSADRDTSNRVEIETIMQTNQRDVELKSHRRSDDDSVITAVLGSKGWNLHVLYREGSWARVQRNGQHWVPWAHLEESDDVWPEIQLPVTDKHTTASHNAWVKLMADVGYKHDKLGLALQNWLRRPGYYNGDLDGYFGPRSVRALQNFLNDKGLYNGLIDGKRGPWTVNAEIQYLNEQAQYY